MARHWFHGRFQAFALPLVKLWAVLRSVRLPEGPGSLGGLGPAAMSVRSVLHIAGLYAALWLRRGNQATQGGNVSPDSAANSGRAGLTPPLPGPAAQEASILPGGQWRPGFGRESSGRPGRHPPLDALRFAELSTALPGGERRLGTVHETSGGPSRSPPAQPVALEGSRALPGQSLATFF